MRRIPGRRQPAQQAPFDISAEAEAPDAEGMGSQAGAGRLQRVQLEKGKRVINLPAITIPAGERVKIMDAGSDRQSLRFSVDGGELAVGGADTTEENGWLLRDGARWVEGDAPDAEWYAVAVSGTVTLRRQIISRV